MRIGLLIYGSLDLLTGGFLYDRYLVRHLQARGHTVEIIALPWRTYGRCLLHNVSPGLLTRVRTAACDLLLQDELTHPSLFLLNQRLKRRIDIPLVTIVHQVLCRQPRPDWQNAFYRAIETRYLDSVDAYIVNSQSTRATLEHLLDMKQRPWIVASPGGDRLGTLSSIHSISTRAVQPGPLRLLFIGNLLPHKGLHTLLEVLSQAPQEIWRLTVVGDLTMNQPYARSIRARIQQAGLSAQVHLTGPLDGEVLAEHLRHSHLFVMPFSQEGFGIVYLEAMAYGLPAIGSSSGAAKDLIQSGHNGFLIDPQHPSALLVHLQRLHHDRECLNQMGYAALKTFQAQPTWAESMEAVHQFIRRLAIPPN
ncbi:glycosyltransferase [candidate division KSB3 bacterium]|uniref:Glycosyltransferase n=1 Tax=candidate division KSB3 bacterium TaxID=2044937 RepID=A0A9D5Q6S9_9BACT|nr:glycosyltransferase [candidate division KSB3 bacterium]MBD3325557.1 glycosyltransferase [candidate division KSB3 bacterium]